MPRYSQTVGFPDGSVAIICHTGPRTKPCSVCGKPGSTKLCDGPGGAPGKTCDKPLCIKCASPGGRNVDYCPEHKRGKREALF